MTIEKIDQKMTYDSTIKSIERSNINVVRQIEGLTVAR